MKVRNYMGNTLLVATVGQGVIRSADDGQNWHRTALHQAIEFDAVVRSLDADPRDPATVYAGADAGLVRSRDVGSTWEQVNAPFNNETVWKVAVDPNDNQRIFVGTGAPSRAVLWRTLDAGKNWYRVPVELPEHCAGVSKPRLLAFAYNPGDRDEVWFGVEEGGLFCSHDGGDTFERVDQRLLWPFNSDVHAVHVLDDAENTVVVVCVNAVYTSKDRGITWSGMLPKTQHGLYYARSLAAPVGTKNTLYLGISDGTPGTTSKILMTTDGAQSWESIELPDPDSCVWAIHVNPKNTQQLVAGTKYGSLYTSDDGGRYWQKQWRSFPEIADVLCSPVKATIKAHRKSDIA